MLCRSQEILQHVDALLYVDTDVLFLRPLEDIWQFFDKFNDRQLAALAPEHEEPTASWYSRFARHPYVPPFGQSQNLCPSTNARMHVCPCLV